MLPNLYPLRFILATLVILYHIPVVSKTLDFAYFKNAAVLNKGHLSVFYFFTLSGFLIIRLIYLELIKTGTFDFRSFYLRRIQRLYPVYYLVLIIGIVLYHFVLPALNIYRGIDYDLPDLILYYVLFTPNIFQYYYNPGSIVQVLWSIGVEEQFYLFIPLLIYLGRKNVLATLSILLMVATTVLFLYPEFYMYRNYFFYFMFGGLCAVASEKYRFTILKNKITHGIIYSLFILSFTTNYLRLGNIALHHTVHMLISGLFFTLVTYYAIFEIKNKLFNYLGKISYGIYMYHMIVATGLFFIADILGLKGQSYPALFIVTFNFLVIALTAMVSYVSYEYFEKFFYQPKPLHTQTNRKAHWKPKRKWELLISKFRN